MRKLALSGLAAVAAVLGGTIPAAASAATTPTPAASATPTVTTTAGLSSFGDKISCVSTTACLAVGADTNSAGNEVPLAQVLRGTKWSTVAVKTPYGSTSTELTGVSCKAANYCLVDGDYVNKAGDDLPYVLTWNGSALTAIVKAPLPSNAGLETMGGVSCVAVKSCDVFATAETASATAINPVEVVWTWNGSQWGRKTAPAASGALDEQFTAADCLSLTSCAVAGTEFGATGTDNELFARWNGTSLTTQTVPASSATISEPTDVSCSSSTNCAVVGFGMNISLTNASSASSPAMSSFLQVWNGTSWKVAKWAGSKSDTTAILLGVSCAAADYCVATGGVGTDSFGAAVSFVWNGAHWVTVGVPGVGKGLTTVLSGVSCPSAGHCVSFGEYGPASAANGKPLAGYLSGTSWRLVHA